MTNKKLGFVFVIVLGFSSMAFAQTDKMTPASPIEFQIATYPMIAVESRLSGKIVVTAHIDKKGNVTSADLFSGPDDICPGVTRVDVVALRESAKTAAMKTKFKPARLNGKPVASTIKLNFEFTPPDSSALDGATPNTYYKKHKKISGGVLNEAAILLPHPSYPAEALAAKADGLVHVEVLIDTEGTVFSAKVISGNPLLTETSRIAACSAKFKQTILSGSPVNVWGVIVYNFTP